MNAYASHMVSYLLAQSWQIALLAGVVGLISSALRNRSAHLRYLLWLIVLAKCLVPPFLTVPLAVLPERSSSPSIVGIALPEEHFALESPVSVGGATQPQQLKPAVPSVGAAIALVWTAGAFFFLLWVGGRAVRYTSWLRAQRRPLPSGLQESIRELSMGFKFRKGPRIWLLEDIRQPFVWGLLRGSVYLPAEFAGLSGSDQQRSVLAHELSHIARFDAGVNLLQVMAQAVYWFHPVVWWSNRKIRQEREKCCDEMAIVHLKTQPEHYTGAIVDALAAERRAAHPIPSLAIVGSVKDIEERIKTMLRPGKTFRKRPSLVAATVALLIAFVTIPTALVLTARGQAQPTAQSVDKPAQLPNKTPADSEKPAPPRYAARTFKSNGARNVWVFVQEDPQYSSRRRIGRAGTAPLQIPACWLWWLRVWVQEQDWDLMVQEISQYKVPGLNLIDATDSDVQRLAGMTWLEGLHLDGDRITNAGLEYLKGLSGLRILLLDGAFQITDAGIACLKDLTGLQELALFGPQMTDAGLARLVKDLSALQTLGLGGTQITDAGLDHLTGLTKLEHLALVAPQITDASLLHLKSRTGLRGLNLGCTQITDAGLAHLKNLTKLQELYLFRTQITGAGLAHLKDLSALRILDLGRTQITDAGLTHLKSLTGLQELTLLETRITDAGLEHLKGLTALRSLDVSGTEVTDAGVQQLKQSLPKLDIIGGPSQGATQSADKPAELPNKPAADREKPEQPRFAARTFTSKVALDVVVYATSQSGRRWVGRTPSATPVEIPACWLWAVEFSAPREDWDLLAREIDQNGVPCLTLDRATDSEMKGLAGLTGLQVLHLTDANITDASLEYLKDLTRLQSLYLYKAAHFTGAGLAHLKGLSGLQTLCLWDTGVTEAGLESLKGLTGLQELLLWKTQITDAGLQHVKSLTGLRTLVLSETQITDVGLEHLKGLTGLQRLDLTATQVTDAGVQRLKESLPMVHVHIDPAK